MSVLTLEEERNQRVVIENFLKPLALDDATLYDLTYRLSRVYHGLALTGDCHFFPTPVTHLPSGQETGCYLAVDVGVTNLRVAFIELLGESCKSQCSSGLSKKPVFSAAASQRRVRRTIEKAWRIEERLKEDQPEALFSWIGSCIAEVVADELSSHSSTTQVPQELVTGLSFSLPIMQKSLDEATLMPIGKGFAINSNLNLRQVLLAGYERHSRRPATNKPSAKRQKVYSLPKLKVAAITNDTVATLVSLAYSVKSLPNTRVAMGIVVGTGCNATIPMKLADLHQSKARKIRSYNSSAAEGVISTEWTLQGTEAPLHELGVVTKWDNELDGKSHRPGFQPFEYMTGARFIGELVRIIIHDYFTNILAITPDALPTELTQPYALTTSFVSDVIARSRSDIDLAVHLSQRLPAPDPKKWAWTPVSVRIIRLTASAVQTRSAALIAAASVGLLACNHEIRLKHPRNSPSKNVPESGLPTDTLIYSGSPSWSSGPEELVVAYTGGIIQHYPNFKETCQRYIDRLVIRGGPHEGGKSIFLREASDGSIVGAGVLAGMVSSK